jgi:hypothetical protein
MLGCQLLEPGAKSIAEFLYREEGLNKTAIGEFLGERWGDVIITLTIIILIVIMVVTLMMMMGVMMGMMVVMVHDKIKIR